MQGYFCHLSDFNIHNMSKLLKLARCSYYYDLKTAEKGSLTHQIMKTSYLQVLCNNLHTYCNTCS